jgi:hypothetical protein
MALAKATWPARIAPMVSRGASKAVSRHHVRGMCRIHAQAGVSEAPHASVRGRLRENAPGIAVA